MGANNPPPTDEKQIDEVYHDRNLLAIAFARAIRLTRGPNTTGWYWSMLGGFGSRNDLGKVRGIVEYPADVHKADAETCPRTLSDELLVDGEPLTLRRYTDNQDNTIGSK
ncbi:hypothetical protein [Natrinema sp. 74]|uniref:hypothetical protein n=1 Tax=Natrinema sp. 74 TaxID=3384159 RepID=UPI0038D4E42F